MTGVERPEIGQWYSRADKGEVFQVVGRDEASGAVEIQVFDGDVDEIDEDTWYTLQLERISPPEDWTGPVDVVEADDLGYSETTMQATDWSSPLQSFQFGRESWEDTDLQEDRDALGEGVPVELFSADLSEVEELAR